MIYPDITSHPGYLCTIDTGKLVPARRIYNGSVCQHGKQLLFAYRYETAEGRSGIAIHALGKNFQPVGKLLMTLPPHEDGTDYEDPRLVVIMGALTLTFVEVRHAPKGDGIFRQVVTLLDLVAFTIKPQSINRDPAHQKNWTLWDAAVGAPWQLQRPRFAWPWGQPSGGTPAMLDARGRLIAFGHAHVPDAKRIRRYNMFAMQLDPATGEVTHVSRRPLWWGSELDLAIVSPRSASWMPLCVFPSGLLIEEGFDFIVSLGVNDSSTAIIRIGGDELELIPIDELPAEAPAAVAGNAATPTGAVRVRVVSTHPIDEPGGPFFKGDEFFTTFFRACALGATQVQILP